MKRQEGDSSNSTTRYWLQSSDYGFIILECKDVTQIEKEMM